MKTNINAGNGFTLLELLLVVAVIAILAALLLPALGRAKAKAQRPTCMNNLRQISLGVRMYSDDSNDKLPKATKHVYFGYKELMKSYVALRGIASAQDKLFACPADVFYYDYVIGHHAGPLVGYVPESLCAQSSTDYSSYAFNGGNLLGMTNIVRPGIAGQALSSIRHPARAVLVAEIPALIPFSWHKPKRPLYFVWTKNCQKNCFFNDAMNMVSFVDGHVSYVKIYWKTSWPPASDACDYDPPDGYDYQWSAN